MEGKTSKRMLQKLSLFVFSLLYLSLDIFQIVSNVHTLPLKLRKNITLFRGVTR